MRPGNRTGNLPLIRTRMASRSKRQFNLQKAISLKRAHTRLDHKLIPTSQAHLPGPLRVKIKAQSLILRHVVHDDHPILRCVSFHPTEV